MGTQGRGWYNSAGSAFAAALTLLALTGCGGGERASAPDHNTPPDLAALLEQEFQRLGIDPDKVAASAPSGGENIVFDIAAELIDPDGEGGEPATVITLAWTERAIGDYDQNGEVNAADLTPIGLRFNDSVQYDAPALHGGLTDWPSGDPAGAGAANWRAARADGNGDGLIIASDITPIAMHWKERIGGYRVYLQAPGETEFSIVPDPQDAGSELSCPRTALSIVPASPVRYGFELPTPAEGVYRLYLKACDPTTDTEGPASAVLSIDTSTGTVNQSPVAKLTVTPDFAGAPAEITLDATASYDLDGSIAAYEWDFEGDGTVDWLSTAPLPEQSSTGTLREIASSQPGLVTAKFIQGSAEYYYPAVSVTDDAGAQSTLATDQLGISGWETVLLNESLENYQLGLTPEVMSTDPQTGDVVVAAIYGHFEIADPRPGIYWGRQTGSGTWDIEWIDVPGMEESVDDGPPSYRPEIVDLFWDEHNQPVILFNLTVEFPQQATESLGVWSAQRKSNGTWDVAERAVSPNPENSYNGIHGWPMAKLGEGRFAGTCNDSQLDEVQTPPNPATHPVTYILSYDHGEWSFEYSGYDFAETGTFPYKAFSFVTDTMHVMFASGPLAPQGLWTAQYESGSGLGEPLRLDDGSVNIGGIDPQEILVGTDSRLHVLSDETLITLDQGILTSHTFVEEYPQYDSLSSVHSIQETSYGMGIFAAHSGKQDVLRIYDVEYKLQSAGKWISEFILYREGEEFPQYVEFVAGAVRNDGTAVALIRHSREDEDFAYSYRLCTRVDPRPLD